MGRAAFSAAGEASSRTAEPLPVWGELVLGSRSCHVFSPAFGRGVRSRCDWMLILRSTECCPVLTPSPVAARGGEGAAHGLPAAADLWNVHSAPSVSPSC